MSTALQPLPYDTIGTTSSTPSQPSPYAAHSPPRPHAPRQSPLAHGAHQQQPLLTEDQLEHTPLSGDEHCFVDAQGNLVILPRPGPTSYGVVRWFDPHKGFGFIALLPGKPIFLPPTTIERSHDDAQSVSSTNSIVKLKALFGYTMRGIVLEPPIQPPGLLSPTALSSRHHTSPLSTQLSDYQSSNLNEDAQAAHPTQFHQLPTGTNFHFDMPLRPPASSSTTLAPGASMSSHSTPLEHHDTGEDDVLLQVVKESLESAAQFHLQSPNSNTPLTDPLGNQVPATINDDYLRSYCQTNAQKVKDAYVPIATRLTTPRNASTSGGHKRGGSTPTNHDPHLPQPQANSLINQLSPKSTISTPDAASVALMLTPVNVQHSISSELIPTHPKAPSTAKTPLSIDVSLSLDGHDLDDARSDNRTIESFDEEDHHHDRYPDDDIDLGHVLAYDDEDEDDGDDHGDSDDDDDDNHSLDASSLVFKSTDITASANASGTSALVNSKPISPTSIFCTPLEAYKRIVTAPDSLLQNNESTSDPSQPILHPPSPTASASQQQEQTLVQYVVIGPCEPPNLWKYRVPSPRNNNFHPLCRAHVFTHQTHVCCRGFRRLQEGQLVEFSLVNVNGKLVAKHITGLNLSELGSTECHLQEAVLKSHRAAQLAGVSWDQCIAALSHYPQPLLTPTSNSLASPKPQPNQTSNNGGGRVNNSGLTHVGMVPNNGSSQHPNNTSNHSDHHGNQHHQGHHIVELQHSHPSNHNLSDTQSYHSEAGMDGSNGGRRRTKGDRNNQHSTLAPHHSNLGHNSNNNNNRNGNTRKPRGTGGRGPHHHQQQQQSSYCQNTSNHPNNAHYNNTNNNHSNNFYNPGYVQHPYPLQSSSHLQQGHGNANQPNGLFSPNPPPPPHSSTGSHTSHHRSNGSGIHPNQHQNPAILHLQPISMQHDGQSNASNNNGNIASSSSFPYSQHPSGVAGMTSHDQGLYYQNQPPQAQRYNNNNPNNNNLNSNNSSNTHTSLRQAPHHDQYQSHPGRYQQHSGADSNNHFLHSSSMSRPHDQSPNQVTHLSRTSSTTFAGNSHHHNHHTQHSNHHGYATMHNPHQHPQPPTYAPPANIQGLVDMRRHSHQLLPLPTSNHHHQQQQQQQQQQQHLHHHNQHHASSNSSLNFLAPPPNAPYHSQQNAHNTNTQFHLTSHTSGPNPPSNQLSSSNIPQHPPGHSGSTKSRHTPSAPSRSFYPDQPIVPEQLDVLSQGSDGSQVFRFSTHNVPATTGPTVHTATHTHTAHGTADLELSSSFSTTASIRSAHPPHQQLQQQQHQQQQSQHANLINSPTQQYHHLHQQQQQQQQQQNLQHNLYLVPTLLPQNSLPTSHTSSNSSHHTGSKRSNNTSNTSNSRSSQTMGYQQQQQPPPQQQQQQQQQPAGQQLSNKPQHLSMHHPSPNPNIHPNQRMMVPQHSRGPSDFSIAQPPSQTNSQLTLTSHHLHQVPVQSASCQHSVATLPHPGQHPQHHMHLSPTQRQPQLSPHSLIPDISSHQVSSHQLPRPHPQQQQHSVCVDLSHPSYRRHSDGFLEPEFISDPSQLQTQLSQLTLAPNQSPSQQQMGLPQSPSIQLPQVQPPQPQHPSQTQFFYNQPASYYEDPLCIPPPQQQQQQQQQQSIDQSVGSGYLSMYPPPPPLFSTPIQSQPQPYPYSTGAGGPFPHSALPEPTSFHNPSNLLPNQSYMQPDQQPSSQQQQQQQSTGF